MSQENVEVVRRWLAAWEGTGDFETGLQTLDEAVVIRRMPPLPDPVVATGREGVLQVTAEWIEDFDEFQMWGEEYFDAGDRVVVRIVQRGRGAGSGALVQRDFWFMYEIGGGKVIRLDLYGERAQAFEAAGLASAADMDPGILRGRDEAD